MTHSVPVLAQVQPFMRTHIHTHTRALCRGENQEMLGYPTNLAANLNFWVANHQARTYHQAAIHAFTHSLSICLLRSLRASHLPPHLLCALHLAVQGEQTQMWYLLSWSLWSSRGDRRGSNSLQVCVESCHVGECWGGEEHCSRKAQGSRT